MNYKLFALLAFISLFSYSQNFQSKLSSVPGIQVHKIENSNFKEYYEVTIVQDLDHKNPGKAFRQRFYVGINNTNAPVVIETDGYAINYAGQNNYTNELTKELKANLVVVEHRYFGKSVPENWAWQYLTTEQAAGDYHYIKTVLEKFLKGKWISTGISKGGQAALAYKLNFPNDVKASVLYGAAVKKQPFIIGDSLIKNLSESTCGNKIKQLQSYMFRHKDSLLPWFDGFLYEKQLEFKLPTTEILFDYLLLEMPYSFWQNGGDCGSVPDTTKDDAFVMNYLVKTVPPRIFSLSSRSIVEPAFYMFYHELGYYEYDPSPFIKNLHWRNYPNDYFVPTGIEIKFDESYIESVKRFVNEPVAESVFFVYGQNDPWALQTSVTKNKYVIQGGNHKSRINNLDTERKTELYKKINVLLK